MDMSLIAVVDNNWGIGKDGGLLFKLPPDMAHFRKLTSGQIVIMGHNTLKSFPGGRALPNRVNLVLSRQPFLDIDGARVCHDMLDVEDELIELPKKQVFVIGGAEVYAQLLPLCKYAYITKVNRDGGADKRLDNLDNLKNWRIVDAGEEQECNDLKYTFIKYENSDM